MNPCRILLADDHAMIRAGLRALLEESGKCIVIAEAANGKEVLDSIARTEVGRRFN